MKAIHEARPNNNKEIQILFEIRFLLLNFTVYIVLSNIACKALKNFTTKRIIKSTLLATYVLSPKCYWSWVFFLASIYSDDDYMVRLVLLLLLPLVATINLATLILHLFVYSHIMCPIPGYYNAMWCNWKVKFLFCCYCICFCLNYCVQSFNR